MTNPPEEQKTKKKKVGCFGCLWILFSFFLLLLAAATGFFYWQEEKVTSFLLTAYTQRLACVLTSPEYYQITEDSDYVIETKGKEKSAGFSKEETAQKILDQRKKEASEAFTTFVEAYKKNPEAQWYASLKELNSKLQEIFKDQKISKEELQDFLTQINQASERHKKKMNEEEKKE